MRAMYGQKVIYKTTNEEQMDMLGFKKIVEGLQTQMTFHSMNMCFGMIIDFYTLE